MGVRSVGLASVLFAAALSSAVLTHESGAKADTPPASIHIALPIEVSRLDNGLEVVLHEDHRTPIVSVNLWYHVGSKDEAAGRSGFAHLFEHVMFQGSKHVPEDTYFRSLERVGATEINGTTNTDRTAYFETVPSNRLELALWLESDRMGFLLNHADAQTFTVQRDVVKNERRQNYENAPYGLVGQFVRAAMYPPEHPYHHLTIGDPKDLDAATLEDVRAFFRAWYVPGNATLVVAGDIDAPKTRAMIEKYFGPIAAGKPPPRAQVPDVKLAGETRLDINAGVGARTQVSWPTPPYYAEGDGDLDLVARVLSVGKTSRLYKRLVYDLQIAQSVSASQSSAQLGSTFDIVATAQPGHTAAELLRAIDEELATLRSGAVSDAELARAKTSILSARVFDVERGSSRAALLNGYGHYTRDFGYLEKDLARYERATAASVHEAAARYLSPASRIVTLVTPTPNAPISGALVRITRAGAP